MNTSPIKKVLIANRGEIARRIIRTLKGMGIASVTVYHAHDQKSPFVVEADQAFALGNGTIAETYLNIEKIIAIAKMSGADAIHPGYGFLSENPRLPEACVAAGIIFIGPDARVVKLMGNKIEARNLAKASGLPITEGYTGSPSELMSIAHTLPYPVLVKAAAGGGGKGMRIVHQAAQLEEVILSTSREAASYFGDETVYVEQYVPEPRHVEIQILADHHGQVVHLFERECSIQRRYQKIIEESPSPSLLPQTRQAMGKAAVDLCKAIGYRNAGTIEFLLDADQKFYFLEMNTRIQVEHPVTELVTGIDLVEEQIRIAMGIPLRFTQDNLKQQGHAIECRIYAEDPENNFMPSPGRIFAYKEPQGDGLRIDSAINRPSEISSQFDPMISKLIVWAPSRTDAINQAIQHLKNYFIAGIRTNIPFLLALLSETDFTNNRFSTAYVDHQLGRLSEKINLMRQQSNPVFPALAALCHFIFRKPAGDSVWHQLGYWRILPVVNLSVDGRTLIVEILKKTSSQLLLQAEDIHWHLENLQVQAETVSFTYQGTTWHFPIYIEGYHSASVLFEGMIYEVMFTNTLPPSIDFGTEKEMISEGGFVSPMPGKVIKVNVEEGEEVNRGTVMIVVEAMKMENNIVAVQRAIVEKIHVKVGDMVDTKTPLIEVKEISE